MSNRADLTTDLRWPTRVALALMTLLLATSLLPLALAGDVSAQETTVSEGDALPPAGSDVIVVLADGEDPQAAADAMGIDVTHIYTNVFTGFAGTVREQPVDTAEATASRKRKPRTKQIALDGQVAAESQFVPTGVSRTGIPQDGSGGLDITPPTNVDIAIIDSGISDLADLDVAPERGYSCIGPSTAWQDDNGHGTHVAGIAAAMDNDIGVVGVAPGARLWAVKVLDSKGGGAFSDVICGLDWVAGHADVIDVANLSLSGSQRRGSCTDQPLHIAVCAVVNAGVQVVVAAGNQGKNADQRVPASYPEVITVSGFSDSDGRPGALGPEPCWARRDDMFLSFSNYGPAVDITAPGGCITSYNQFGTLVAESGTSEAAPHVAGAIANFIAGEATRPTPDQSRNWLLTEASRPQSVDGLIGDKDSAASREQAKKSKVKQAKKKVKNAKSKKAKKKAKKQLKQARKMSTVEGNLEPVLWLESLP